MRDVIELARKMADRYTINHVVIGSLGNGARRAVEFFGVDDFQIHAVVDTGAISIEDEGVPEMVEQIEQIGVSVHFLPNSLFQALSSGGDCTIEDTTYTFSGDDFPG